MAKKATDLEAALKKTLSVPITKEEAKPLTVKEKGSRQGMKMWAGYIDDAKHRKLSIIAKLERRTMQELLSEATDGLLEKYSKYHKYLEDLT